MNCQEFEIIVRDLAWDLARDPASAEFSDARVDVTVNANGHQQAVDHVGACGACALRLQDERALSRALASVVTEMKTLAPDAGVEQKLLEAFRQAPGSAGILPAFSIRKRSGQDARVPRNWIAAVAALFLLVAGVFALRAFLSPPVDPKGQNIEALNLPKNLAPATDKGPDNSSTMTAAAGSVSTAGSASSTNPQPPRPIRKSSRQIARRQLKPSRDTALATAAVVPALVENPGETEVTTQFIALSYLGPASLQDGGQIVRVELPRSAMASFGLPVNMDRFGEKVRADVFVSADGFARAIRFVQ